MIHVKVQYVENVPIQTQCATNHLTSFGTGFFKTENAIDFSFIFADFDYADHVTIFIVLLVTFIMFLVTLIWAQINDMKDVQKVKNKSLFKYFVNFLFSKSPTGCLTILLKIITSTRLLFKLAQC